MKLLLVTKRHFMTKDIIASAYGRQYELASRLQSLGWEVRAYCLNYRTHWDAERIDAGGIEWHSYPASTGLARWRRDSMREAAAWRPDAVLGCADPLHIAAGHRISRVLGTPLAIDLHDNLDSFRSARIPWFRTILRRAIECAELVACVSGPLRDMILGRYRTRGRVVVLENAVPDAFLERGERAASRGRLDMPASGRVVGVSGALYRKRGIDTILTGFDLLRERDPALTLALAGPVDGTRRRLDRDGIRYFGNLDYALMPDFQRSLDVGVVPNIRPAFADYCYPQKAVEMCALGVPIVAAKLGVMKDLAAGNEQILYQPHDPADFARAVAGQLDNRVVLEAPVKRWSEQAARFHGLLSRLVRQSATGDDAHANPRFRQ